MHLLIVVELKLELLELMRFAVVFMLQGCHGIREMCFFALDFRDLTTNANVAVIRNNEVVIVNGIGIGVVSNGLAAGDVDDRLGGSDSRMASR